MAEIKKYTVTEPYLKIDCKLGEGPYYEEANNTLRFLDVWNQKIHTIDLSKGPSSHAVLADLDISVGVTADIEGKENEIAIGGKHGYAILDRKTGKYRYIKKVWTDEEIADGKDKRMRGNDGAVDSKGRFWLGFMNDPKVAEVGPEGALFRLDPDLSLHRVLDGVTIPNGAVWSPDDKHFYWADSPTSDIYVFDFDAETGAISNKRVFYHCEQEGCVPDGHCLDVEGYMWTAIHGMGKVLRISPEGKVVAEIELPTRCVTCPCFAGEDLFITSMEDGDAENQPESAKYMGSLFKCHVGIRGLKPNRFRLQSDI